jgi:hypothetical protein
MNKSDNVSLVQGPSEEPRSLTSMPPVLSPYHNPILLMKTIKNSCIEENIVTLISISIQIGSHLQTFKDPW